jgi:hypothetical protein
MMMAVAVPPNTLDDLLEREAFAESRAAILEYFDEPGDVFLAVRCEGRNRAQAEGHERSQAQAERGENDRPSALTSITRSRVATLPL